MVSPCRALKSHLINHPAAFVSIPHPKLHCFRIPARGHWTRRFATAYRVATDYIPEKRVPARRILFISLSRTLSRRPIFNYFCAVIPSYYGKYNIGPIGNTNQAHKSKARLYSMVQMSTTSVWSVQCVAASK